MRARSVPPWPISLRKGTKKRNVHSSLHCDCHLDYNAVVISFGAGLILRWALNPIVNIGARSPRSFGTPLDDTRASSPSTRAGRRHHDRGGGWMAGGCPKKRCMARPRPSQSRAGETRLQRNRRALVGPLSSVRRSSCRNACCRPPAPRLPRAGGSAARIPTVAWTRRGNH